MTTTVIIGNASTVSFDGACVISANWSFDPGRQDAYCLDGTWGANSAYTVYKPQRTLSLTIYSPSEIHQLTPTTACVTTNTITASVSAVGCEGGTEFSGPWLVASYSYSKPSAEQPGQESWSLVDYENSGDIITGGNVALPTFVLRAPATGSSTNEAISGIVFSEDRYADGLSGSISANSTGTSSSTVNGTVTAVGGGVGINMGEVGEGNVSVPLTPMYI